MAQTIPLIRAAALVPMILWMRANGRPVERRLREVDLGYLPLHNPDLPVPLLNVVAFLRNASRAEGPDIGCRVVEASSLTDLSMIAKVAMGARTPRRAMERIVALMPHHSSHETISVTSRSTGVVVQDAWSTPFDPETLHIVQQFVAALLSTLCRTTGHTGPCFERIEIVPHPEAGIDHLRPWFGATVHPAASDLLSLTIAPGVFDLPFRDVGRDRMQGPPPPEWAKLRGDGTLAATVRLVINAMLDDATPTIGRVTAASGMSQRSLQRQLAREGTSFTALLDEVRRDQALRRLADSRGALAGLASDLGFSGQATLTRAVRRWTGKPPTQVAKRPKS